jgi:5-methylthioribose kinase
MGEPDKPKSEMLSIDKDQLKTALKEVIEREVTNVVKLSLQEDKVAEVIRYAFNKSWRDNSDTWLEESIKTSANSILHQAVRESLEAAGIPAMVDAAIKEFIETDEFKTSLKERALQTVRDTTFFVRPVEEDEPKGPTI